MMSHQYSGLPTPACANVVVNALHHFDGVRYDLISYVVMPSHIHWVFRPCEKWMAQSKFETRSARERILHSINRFTSQECNRILGRGGAFWQHESYDHWVRDMDELARIIQYIEWNPVKAKFVARPEDWPYSSASRKK